MDCITVPYAPVDDKAEPDRDVAEMPDAPELDLQDASPLMQEVLAEADALVAEVAGEVAGASKRYASPHFAPCDLRLLMAAALGLTSWGVSADLRDSIFAHVWLLQSHVERSACIAWSLPSCAAAVTQPSSICDLRMCSAALVHQRRAARRRRLGRSLRGRCWRTSR